MGGQGVGLWSARGHVAAVCDASQGLSGVPGGACRLSGRVAVVFTFVVPPHLDLVRICCLLPAENEKIITKTHGTITHMVSMGEGGLLGAVCVGRGGHRGLGDGMHQ